MKARLNVNVALRRQAWQVSTFYDGYGVYYPQYANDGGHSTDLHYGPCMHTLHATNPWWAVDLVVALYVAGVKFTNRNSWRTYSILCSLMIFLSECQCQCQKHRRRRMSRVRIGGAGGAKEMLD